MEDSQIIQLYLERKEDAIAQTDTKYGAYCHRIAMNILSVKEDAEECVSDAYHQAWNAIPPERPRKFRVWLGRIVRNISLNLWNKNHAQKRNRGMETLLGELEDCIPAENTVEKALEAAELGEVISKWLLSLEEKDRTLFVLRYWKGEPLNKLAGDWGVTANKLAGRMYRLRLDLKAALEEEGIYL